MSNAVGPLYIWRNRILICAHIVVTVLQNYIFSVNYGPSGKDESLLILQWLSGWSCFFIRCRSKCRKVLHVWWCDVCSYGSLTLENQRGVSLSIPPIMRLITDSLFRENKYNIINKCNDVVFESILVIQDIQMIKRTFWYF